MVGGGAVLWDCCRRCTCWGGRGGSGDEREGGGGGLQIIVFVIAIVWAILAPSAARFVQLAISRQREYRADASSVERTRNPDGLEGEREKSGEEKEVVEGANRAT